MGMFKHPFVENAIVRCMVSKNVLSVKVVKLKGVKQQLRTVHPPLVDLTPDQRYTIRYAPWAFV